MCFGCCNWFDKVCCGKSLTNFRFMQLTATSRKRDVHCLQTYFCLETSVIIVLNTNLFWVQLQFRELPCCHQQWPNLIASHSMQIQVNAPSLQFNLLFVVEKPDPSCIHSFFNSPFLFFFCRWEHALDNCNLWVFSIYSLHYILHLDDLSNQN